MGKIVFCLLIIFNSYLFSDTHFISQGNVYFKNKQFEIAYYCYEKSIIEDFKKGNFVEFLEASIWKAACIFYMDDMRLFSKNWLLIYDEAICSKDPEIIKMLKNNEIYQVLICDTVD